MPDTLGDKRVNLSLGVSLPCGICHSLTLGPGLYNCVANRYYGPQPPSLSFINPKARHVQPCCRQILQTSAPKSVILCIFWTSTLKSVNSLTLGPDLHKPVADLAMYYGPQSSSPSFPNPRARPVQPCCRSVCILWTSTLKSVIP